MAGGRNKELERNASGGVRVAVQYSSTKHTNVLDMCWAVCVSHDHVFGMCWRGLSAGVRALDMC